ncbi:MAG: ferrochelatase [Rhodobacteraceae bacterium]|nr:ferrochelatase [Paracoccaceae bacterium]
MRTTSRFCTMGKIGILLINLGTPDATDYWSMRRYLKQFLSDKRVIEAKGPIWWLIFNGIILTKRPRSSGRAYDLIWNTERDESPLRTITRAQSDKVADLFADQEQIVVDWAMRYGTPSIEQRIAHLTEQGCERILFFPLYPQYSSATTGTAMDSAFDALKTLRNQPTIRTIAPYFNHTAYITALAESIRTHHASLPWKPEVTIASLHGLPVDFIAKGDPYQNQCEATVDLLREELGLTDWQLLLTYQSRTGRTEWIGPDTEETIQRLAQDGIKNLSIVAPGFSADCVETLEEIGLRAVAKFKQEGGKNCTVVPCLNESDASISMLETLIAENLQGWN